MVWFENAEQKIDLEPIPLTYELMTRSRKVDYERLKKRDLEFVALYDEWRGADS